MSYPSLHARFLFGGSAVLVGAAFLGLHGCGTVVTSNFNPDGGDTDALTADDSPFNFGDSANNDGDQRFTTTLKRDGFSGDIGFSLPGTPGDLTLTSSSVSGTQVTFVVHSARKDLGTAPKEIASSMHKAEFSTNDVALAMRLSGHQLEETQKALASASFPKSEIAPALKYAGYKL